MLTPDNLQKLDLLKPGEWTDDEADNLNFLMDMALKKIPLVAFSYVMYRWRHDVMTKRYAPEKFNCRWWELVEEFQGLTAPEVRSDDMFDAGSKWHVVADLPFLRFAT
jgi:peptidyl-dipeptidase A